jgi:hypothetical protein
MPLWSGDALDASGAAAMRCEPFRLGLGTVLRDLKAVVSDDSFQRRHIRIKEGLIQLLGTGRHCLSIGTAIAVSGDRIS